MLAQPKAHEAGCIDWILKLYCKHTKRNIKQVRNAQAKMSSTRSSKYQGQNGHLTSSHGTLQRHISIGTHLGQKREFRDHIGPFESSRTNLTSCKKFEDHFDYFAKTK